MTQAHSAKRVVRLYGAPAVLSEHGSNGLSPFQMAVVSVVFAQAQVSRPELGRLIWGKSLDSGARHRIRQLLHSAQKKAGAALFESDGDLVKAAPAVGSDVRSLRAALSQGRLLDAAEVIVHGFLAGGTAPVSEDFQDWKMQFELTMLSRLRRSAERAWSTGCDASDWPRARDAAEALYLIDVDRAESVARVIEARARVGRLQAAEAAFGEHTERRGRLGPHPMPAAAIERARSAMPKQVGRELAPFVGRTKALGVLNATINDISRGESRYALVFGEAGIGKSRVLEEVTRHAALQGVRTLTARPVELERRISLNPLIDALSPVDLDSHLGLLGEPWRSVIGATLRPGSLVDPIEDPPPIDEKSLPRRLMDAFSLLLESIAREQPTLLLIDDLHWADATTVAVLHFFRRRWTGMSFGLVASVRPEAVGPRDPVAAWLRDELRYPHTRVSLEELDPQESRELFGLLSEDRIDGCAAEKLLTLAAEHPLYLTELTRDYLAGRLILPASHAEALTVPVSLKQILTARWERCSEGAVRAAQMLAVASRPMRVGELASVLGYSVDDTLDSVEELRERRLCTADRDRVWIAHDLFKSAIYSDLSAPRQALLHGQFAEHLSRAGGDGSHGELGVHFDKAGDRVLAAQHGRKAGARAMSQGAVAEAAHFYELVARNEDDQTAVAEATAGYATAYYLGRDMRRADSALELAATRLRETGRMEQARRMSIRRVEALAEAGGTPVDELVARLSAIKRDAWLAEDWEAVAFTLDAQLRLALFEEDFASVREVCAESTALLPWLAPDAQAVSHGTLAIGLLIDQSQAALESARAAVRLTGIDAPDHRLRFLNRALIVFHHQGQLACDEARSLIEEAAALSRKSGDLLQRFSLESNLGVSHLDAGNLDHAEARFTVAESLLGEADMTFPRINLACNLGELALARGDLPGAVAAFQSAQRHTGEAIPRYAAEIIAAGLGLCAAEGGQLATARQYEERLRRPPELWYHDPFLIVAFRARLLERRGSPERAAQLLSEVADDVYDRLIPSWLKIQYLLARVLLRNSDERAAREASRRGQEVAEAIHFATRARAFRRVIHQIEGTGATCSAP